MSESIDGRLEARWADERPGTGVFVDFSAVALPGGAAATRGMPLVRACGRESARSGATLVDATAGLGYDSFLLAVAGFRVTSIERSPRVAALLEDGLRRLAGDASLGALVGERIRLLAGDARRHLAALGQGGDIDVVYLDPMYPPKKRASALPPKEMQIVRALVGSDDDARELFEVARTVARRVVVKRPLHAAPLAEPKATIAGKLARFDVFTGSGGR